MMTLIWLAATFAHNVTNWKRNEQLLGIMKTNKHVYLVIYNTNVLSKGIPKLQVWPVSMIFHEMIV